jgi:hypothetical protein
MDIKQTPPEKCKCNCHYRYLINKDKLAKYVHTLHCMKWCKHHYVNCSIPEIQENEECHLCACECHKKEDREFYQFDSNLITIDKILPEYENDINFGSMNCGLESLLKTEFTVYNNCSKCGKKLSCEFRAGNTNDLHFITQPCKCQAKMISPFAFGSDIFDKQLKMIDNLELKELKNSIIKQKQKMDKFLFDELDKVIFMAHVYLKNEEKNHISTRLFNSSEMRDKWVKDMKEDKVHKKYKYTCSTGIMNIEEKYLFEEEYPQQSEMTDKETSHHIRNWLMTDQSGSSWPTDGCGYNQHMKFVEYKNKNYKSGNFNEFVLEYAKMLEGESLK